MHRKVKDGVCWYVVTVIISVVAHVLFTELAIMCVHTQRKEQLQEEARKATNSEVKKEVLEKMKEAEEDVKYWKGKLKNWDNQTNQHEKALKQATKKGKGDIQRKQYVM